MIRYLYQLKGNKGDSIMGAEVFSSIQTGKTAQEAFENAQEQAYWDYGHAGYTGTIAEKPGFTEFPRPKGMQEKAVRNLMESISDIGSFALLEGMNKLSELHETYPKFSLETLKKMMYLHDDKWGKAICMELKPNLYHFCGWASS
jgi:hypothetical protein